MPIFKEEDGRLKKLKLNPVAKEKTLQTLIEQNLLEVLDLHFLETEYATTFGGRIDTIAIDSNGAPVIIEYKLTKNENVINQALSYLRWLKAQKVEFFEMLVIKKLGKNIADKLKIDWTNPRVICIAENYSKFDIDTVEVIPIRLELFKYRFYEDRVFYLEQVNIIEQTKLKEEVLIDENKTIVIPYLENQLLKALPYIKELFNDFRSRVLQIDENIIEKVTGNYVAYKVSKNFAEVTIVKQQIKIHLRPIDYDDPLNIVEEIPESYKWTLSRRVVLKSVDELDYILKLVEKSYNDVI
jgi:predicted transport protein